MKWFQHQVDASDDEFIVELEHRFGWEGYGRWWKLLEVVGKQSRNGRFMARLSWVKWQTNLKGKRNKLTLFLEHCRNEERIILRETGNILEIEIPKLNKFKDEYSRKSGHTPDDRQDNVAGAPKTAIVDVVDVSLSSNEERRTESQKPTTSKAPRRERRALIADDAPEMLLAVKFYREHVTVMNPNAPDPNWQTEANHFGKLLRKKHSVETIEHVIAFVHGDRGRPGSDWPGWSVNILSAGTFYKKFDRLVVQATAKQALKSAPTPSETGGRRDAIRTHFDGR